MLLDMSITFSCVVDEIFSKICTQLKKQPLHLLVFLYIHLKELSTTYIKGESCLMQNEITQNTDLYILHLQTNIGLLNLL